MTIIRAPREERFTVLNRTIVNDERLSYRALGLLVYLLDKPDNWRVESTELARGEGREGRDAVRSALTELADVGYLVRRRRQNDKAQWVTETFLYDTPGHTDDGETDDGETDAWKSGVGFSGASTKTGNDDGNEDCSSSPPTPRKRGEVDEAFEEWWTLYPKKKAGKGQARDRWRKMTLGERVQAIGAIERHVAWWVEHTTDEQFIPAGNVWLNQRRWEDDEPRTNGGARAPTSMMDRVRARLEAERETSDQTQKATRP